MILFSEDWNRYDAIPDLQTKNLSFLHAARVLKALGVKNHMFHLCLYNPYLREVDPHSPTISPEEIMMVVEECKINFWYFLREVARAPGQSGAPARPVEANRGNLALFWCFFNRVMTLLIQIRQTGKSFNVDLLGAYLMQIRCSNTQINLLTKDETLRRANIQRLKDIMDALPVYLDSRGKKDANNTELITVKERGNLYQGHLPQASEKLAGNVGRGLTSPIFFVDEPPFQLNIQEALPAALSAGGAARDLAEAADEPSGTILTTTAGKKDTKEGKYFYNFMAGMAEWADKFYDCANKKDLEKVLRVNGRDREYRVNITMNHQQLGKTDDWLAKKIGESVSTGEAADRDYFNRWTAGTTTNPLNIQTLEKIRASQREPLHVETCEPGGYVVRWFIPEDQVERRMKSSKYVVVLDTSEASGGDDISLRVTDLYTGEMVATGTYNETNIITFCEWVATWLTRWDTTTLLPERRSTGVTLIDMLLLILPAKGIDPFERIFNRIVNEHDEMPDRYKEISEPMWRRDGEIYVRNKKAFGFATSSSGVTSRSELYGGTLHQAAKQVGHLVCDKITIDQIASLIIKNGRVDHPAGEHDDMCFIGSTLVRTIEGNKPIKNIRLGDLVLTRQGYKPVVKIFKSEKDVITRFGLTGTSNHPFITPNGEVEFKDLTSESNVYVWNEKQLNIEVKSITDTLTQNECSIENTSIDTIKTTHPLLRYIVKFTKTTKDPFQKVITSIMTMMTTSTTTQTTSSVFHQANTLNAMSKSVIIIPLKNVPVEEQFSMTGVKIIKNRWHNSLSKMVGTVRLLPSGDVKTLNLQNKPIALPEEKTKARKEIVYNLMVADCHEYFVNDILVHNCIGWILTHWFMTKARNIQHYGINPSAILKDLRSNQTSDPVDLYKISVQQKVRDRIEEVSNLFQKESDEFMSRRYEQELRYLYSRLELRDNEKISVEELITKTKEDKLRKRIDGGARRGTAEASPYEKEHKFRQQMGYGQKYESSMFGSWRR